MTREDIVGSAFDYPRGPGNRERLFVHCNLGESRAASPGPSLSVAYRSRPKCANLPEAEVAFLEAYQAYRPRAGRELSAPSTGRSYSHCVTINAQRRGTTGNRLKPFAAILWVANPTRKSLASSRKRVLHAQGVTLRREA